MRFLVAIPDEQVHVLDELVRLGSSPSRNALIQQIIGAFISDLRDKRPEKNPDLLQSALGALVGGFLFGLGIAALAELFGGEK